MSSSHFLQRLLVCFCFVWFFSLYHAFLSYLASYGADSCEYSCEDVYTPGCGDGSMYKVHAVQAQIPESGATAPTEKPGHLLTCTYMLMGRGRQVYPQSMMASQFSQLGGFKYNERLYLKDKNKQTKNPKHMENNRKGHTVSGLCKHMHSCA